MHYYFTVKLIFLSSIFVIVWNEVQAIQSVASMKFLKLSPSCFFYLDFTIFHMLWERLGTNRRNWRSVCHDITSCFDQRWGGTADMAGVLQGLLTGWDCEGCTVVGIFVVRLPWRLLKFFLLGEWGVSWEGWVRPNKGSVGDVGRCLQEALSVNEWGAVDIVHL